jgi:hypothetical protein
MSYTTQQPASQDTLAATGLDTGQALHKINTYQRKIQLFQNNVKEKVPLRQFEPVSRKYIYIFAGNNS